MLLRFRFWFTTLFLLIIVSCYSTTIALAGPSITVNLPSRTIELFADNKVIKEFPIAIGKASTPTPIGTFAIISKDINPAWYPPDQPGKVVPSGPDNPLGYRWLGIWNNYGIHGTNAPESIGDAVSNGCIRMQEVDVEELFELVNCGTPVKITYDRVKVRTNARGQVLLAVYPDIYGYSSITVQDVRNKLNTYRLNTLVPDELLREMINDPSDEQVVIANRFAIQVNGKQISEQGLIVQDVRYVPIYAVAGTLKRQIKWDEKTKVVQYGATTVPGIVVDNVVYVATDKLTALFASQPSWKNEENTLFLEYQGVFLNDKPVNLEVHELQGIAAVPALPLAEALGYKVNWNQEKQLLTMAVKGEIVTIPIVMVDSVPFIKITNINQYFNAYVYWNKEAKTIEFIYP
ncbi:L,D-transpeptidase family protein [Sporomusa sp. KB1]|uniref:L,D-transpeptidase family protein n=1 Tax=Sporomusa sp. KB1 TaxID=943346 RepID=UPI0011ADF4CD|nr:L,D-transpeptidase family protein [Sporomusa sp. KB1]TWH49377.1 lipoprotein-anchoring transpeptidase ErfK/SrfK [Sporomusa sp. KB1]